MLPETVEMQGDAIADETQLDGKRHLTVELADARGDWLCTVHLILDREGGEHEAELELEGPEDAVWSGAMVSLDVTELDESVELQGIFRADEGAAADLELREGEGGAFTATVRGGAA